jgi:hypothetical protein
MVIAFGFRARVIELQQRTDSHAKSIRERLASGKLAPEQAVEEALHSHRTQGVAPMLKANFAFTKAYMAESAGKKAGFDGCNCFVEDAVFENRLPPGWIATGPQISWRGEGIDTRFYPISAIDRDEAAKANHRGILDGIAVAENLTNATNVLDLLRSHVLTESRR